MKRPAAALAALLLITGPASLADEEADLEELRRAIEERRERVAAYAGEEEGLFAAIEAVERAAQALRREVARAERAAADAEAEQRRLAAEEAVLALRVEETEAALSRRAVALYKAGGAGPLRLIFS